MKHIHTLYRLVFVVFLLLSMGGMAQNDYSSTEEMATGANKLFEQEQYIQAFPLYSQLLSLDRDNPELSYRFGVCLLYSDRSDTYAPITYLKKALNHVSEPEIYYFLGFAYHINYYFPAAISFYEQYKEKAGRKARKSFDVDRKIEMCHNGMKMMKSVKDLFVLQKTEVSRDEFFRSYDLSDMGSRMISKPETFLSKEDQRKKELDFIFFNTKADAVYYSGYSSTNKNQRDIFRRVKLAEGGWSKPEKLSEIINTAYDEDFPVMMPDGKTLYFSSKGHNTIGGYDIFKSVFNTQTQLWSEPENINFPFNTPVDDILFVSDSLESTAWFASVRNSVSDKIMVYKVGIIKRPEGSTDLAAIYAKNKELTEADLKEIKDRARLDVNISSKEYEDIPEPIVDHTVTTTQTMSHTSEMGTQAKIEEKQQEQLIIDSAKTLVNQLEKNIDAFDSIRQNALSMAASKKIEAHRLREDIKQQMKLVLQSSEMSAYQKVVDESNRKLLKAERLDYEVSELKHLAEETSDKIDDQNLAFASVNQLYGDVEGAVLRGDKEAARQLITKMDARLQQLPQVKDMQLVFNMEEGGLLQIQYPENLTNPDAFDAFTVSNSHSNPQIVATDSVFNKLIPQPKETVNTPKEDIFSSIPSERVTQYMQAMQNYVASLDVQISNKQDIVNQAISGFEQLPDDQKTQVVQNLNKTLKEQYQFMGESKFIQQQLADLQAEYQRTVLSSANPETKVASYQQMAKQAEKIFDFNKNTLVNSSISFSDDFITPLVQYQINDQRKLEKRTVAPHEFVSSSQLSFDEKDAEKIETQATQMLSNARSQVKRNAFGMQKIQRKIDNLSAELEQNFKKATASIQSARKAEGADKELFISQANKYFSMAEKKAQDIAQFKKLLEQMQTANEDSQAIIANLSQDVDGLEKAVSQGDWERVRDDYLSVEKNFHNQQQMLDFSEQIDMQQLQLLNAEEATLRPNFIAYQKTPQGDIVKTFGNPSEDWSSYQDFSKDVTAVHKSQNLVLGPNVSLHSTLESYTKIFNPEIINNVEDIDVANIQLPKSILNSNQSLIQNTLAQVQNLRMVSHLLAKKRNIVNKYYQEILVQAADLEKQSIKSLQDKRITSEDVAKANILSRESKKLLWKAAQASLLIQDYDQAIAKNLQLISEGKSVLRKMDAAIQDKKNEDDVLLLNVRFQQKVTEEVVDDVPDKKFNFALHELFVETPAIFDSIDNQEFVLSGGQVRRNSQPYLHQYFYQHRPKQNIQLVHNAMIIPTAGATAATKSQEHSMTTHGTKDSLTLPAKMQNSAAVSVAVPKNRSTEIPTNHADSLKALGMQNSINNSTLDTIDVQSYRVDEFHNDSDIRNALGDLNAFAQKHMNNIEATSDALAVLAERELGKSSEKSLQGDSLTNLAKKRAAQKVSKEYLYRAMAAKSLAEKYQAFADKERAKQQKITETSFQIEKKLNAHQLDDAKVLFQAMQDSVHQFGESYQYALNEINIQMIAEQEGLKQRMDSAYNDSQVLANKAVMLLSQSAEDRKKAEGKHNAFKRRELLKQAEDKELQATRIQNESDKILEAANTLYAKNQQAKALISLQDDINQIITGSSVQKPTANVNKAVVFENINQRKDEVFNGTLNTTAQNTTVAPHSVNSQKPQSAADGIHAYERENFKAQLISDELGILKREIALLVKTDQSHLSDKEIYVLNSQIKIYRQKTDSLEYEANKAFELANLVLSSLSEEDQQKAKQKGRSFDDYLSDLKTRIESLLSEASSLKHRAQRSNNMETRAALYNQAKDKEEVAMYLILEEFEVIAQKNKTRYRKNQLILQQMMMENASLQERELMQGIFSRIDSYFDQAKQKREKANAKGVSFNMRKILLQDAYSLEMKALDLQQKAKTMLDKHDVAAMMTYQKHTIQQDKKQEIAVKETENQLINKTDTQSEEPPKLVQTQISHSQEAEKAIQLGSPGGQGIVYKVQFIALPQLKAAGDFKNVSEVTAERVPQSNFIRYFSGNFNQLDLAMIRRNSLRASGYPDAFIRTWKNGETVSLLSLKEKSNHIPLSSGSAEGPNLNAINYAATNITNLSGTYYSVQVGVYSRPRTSAMIFGISPLYHRRMTNGFWIYYSGIFKSLAQASEKRDDIRQRGIRDAFVVAFSNGKPISLSQAQIDMSRGARLPQHEDIVVLEDASQQIESDWNIAQNTNEPSSTNAQATVYKVQIGVYSNPVNMDWISSQLDGNDSVDMSRNTNGKYVYSVGNFDNEQDARLLLKQMKELVPDAFISGFQGDLKIYIR